MQVHHEKMQVHWEKFWVFSAGEGGHVDADASKTNHRHALLWREKGRKEYRGIEMIHVISEEKG